MFCGDRLANLMEKEGVSQSELARRIRVSPTTIWKLVNEPMQGSKHTHRIARELSTSPAYLMGETDDPTAEQPSENFSSEEREWMALLRHVGDKQRRALLTLARSLAEPSDLFGSTVHEKQQTYRTKS